MVLTMGAVTPRELAEYEQLMAGDDSRDLRLLMLRPPWTRDAACREHPDVRFFTVQGEPLEPAKQICRGCLVRSECLEHALSRCLCGVTLA
jgi:hypothetical protein